MFPALYAHRLGRAYGPDSSLTALERALSGPLDGLETDVCLTADERLVLLHDPLLELNTTARGWAHERSLAAIRASRLRDGRGIPTDQRPLSLEEVLREIPDGVVVQLEVKAHADPVLARRTAEVLCEALRREPIRHRVEVLSFHSEACAIAAARGLPTRLVIWADYAPGALAGWAARHGLIGVSVEHFLLTESLTRVMRLAGLSVNTGTINNRELLERVAALEPDAVCTDRPHELRAEARDMRPVGMLPIAA